MLKNQGRRESSFKDMEKILYNAMFSKIQKDIRKYKEELEKVEKVDAKYSKIKPEISKFIYIIEKYKDVELEDKKENITFICNGNPYIVLNLAMIAITKNLYIKINVDNTMLGTNKYILEIINKIIKENKINTKIELIENFEGEKIVFIDRINDFNIIKEKTSNTYFIPYQSIDVYSESEKFEELYETVYNYAIDMNIDIDIFDDEGIEAMLKYGKSKKKLILTNKKETKNKYKNPNIYINENPFKQEELVFSNDIIEKCQNCN